MSSQFERNAPRVFKVQMFFCTCRFSLNKPGQIITEMNHIYEPHLINVDFRSFLILKIFDY